MGCFDAAEGTQSSTTKSTSTSTSYLPKQKSILNKALKVYEPTVGQGADIYPGQRVAPLTENEKGVFDFAAGGGFVTTPQQVNDYFKSGIQDPTMRNLKQDVLPAVKEAFSGPGYWSSARATEEARATEDTVAELGRQKAQLQWDTLQANKQGALQQGAVGETERAYNQQVIDASIQKFAEENAITDPTNLAIIMNLLGISMTKQETQSKSTTTGEQQGAGLGYDLSGPIAQGLASGAAQAMGKPG